MERLPNPHPSEIIREYFKETLDEMPWCDSGPEYFLAWVIADPVESEEDERDYHDFIEFFHGRQSLKPHWAPRLAVTLGCSSEFWMNLQKAYDQEWFEKRVVLEESLDIGAGLPKAEEKDAGMV